MVNFFTSVREAGRGKEEVVLPSHVCSKNGKELGHQPGKSAPLYLFPGMKLPVGTPWGITPRGRWQLPNSSTFQETYETNFIQDSFMEIIVQGCFAGTKSTI